jgi:BMFP domain-containing protein YqiC
MSNLDEKVDKLEAAVDPNTVISIGGFNFTPAKLMVAGAIVSSTLGGLYGAFEVYKDYMSMKEAIQTYVAPDLSELNKKIAVLEENSNKTVEYSNEIKNDLKQDIRRLEGVVENVERSSKQLQREVMLDVKDVREEVRRTSKETEQSIREVKKEVDAKIKKALDNPLANN